MCIYIISVITVLMHTQKRLAGSEKVPHDRPGYSSIVAVGMDHLDDIMSIHGLLIN